MPRQYPAGVGIANRPRPKGRRRRFPRDLQSPRFLSNLAAPSPEIFKYRIIMYPDVKTNYFSQKYGAQEHTVYAYVEKSIVDFSGEFTKFGSDKDVWVPASGVNVEFYLEDWGSYNEFLLEDEFGNRPEEPIESLSLVPILSDRLPSEDAFFGEHPNPDHDPTGNGFFFSEFEDIVVYPSVTNSEGVAIFTFVPLPRTYNISGVDLGGTVTMNIDVGSRIRFNNDENVFESQYLDANSNANGWWISPTGDFPEDIIEIAIAGSVSKDYCEYPIQYWVSGHTNALATLADSEVHNGFDTGCPSGLGGRISIVHTAIAVATGGSATPPTPEGTNIKATQLGSTVSARFLIARDSDYTVFSSLWLVQVDDLSIGTGSVTSPTTSGNWETEGRLLRQWNFQANCPIEIIEIESNLEALGDLYTSPGPLSSSFNFTDQNLITSLSELYISVIRLENEGTAGIQSSDYDWDGSNNVLGISGAILRSDDAEEFKIGLLTNPADANLTYFIQPTIVFTDSVLSLGSILWTAKIRIESEPPLILTQDYGL